MIPGGILKSFGFSGEALAFVAAFFPASISPSPLSGAGGGEPPLFLPEAAATLDSSPAPPFYLRQDL